jgi:hypothetical protein
MDSLPNVDAYYAIPVQPALHEVAGSGQCFAFSFLQPKPRDLNLAVQLTVPIAGPVRDLHPLVSAPCRAHHKKSLILR